MRDVGKAAKDWPQLNFVIYHSAYRHSGGGNAAERLDTNSSRPAASPGSAILPTFRQKYGVTNVYGDVGQLFAQSVVAEPRLGAALMGILVKGLGADHVCWGTDAIWTGSPQWQIEALRRLEIPEDMQKKYGFQPLGGADGTRKDRHFQRQQHAPLWSAEAHRPRRPVRRMKEDYSRTAPRAATCATATPANLAPARPEQLRGAKSPVGQAPAAAAVDGLAW